MAFKSHCVPNGPAGSHQSAVPGNEGACPSGASAALSPEPPVPATAAACLDPDDASATASFRPSPAVGDTFPGCPCELVLAVCSLERSRAEPNAAVAVPELPEDPRALKLRLDSPPNGLWPWKFGFGGTGTSAVSGFAGSRFGTLSLGCANKSRLLFVTFSWFTTILSLLFTNFFFILRSASSPSLSEAYRALRSPGCLATSSSGCTSSTSAWSFLNSSSFFRVYGFAG